MSRNLLHVELKLVFRSAVLARHYVIMQANADLDGSVEGVARRPGHRHALYPGFSVLPYNLLLDAPGGLLPAAD